MKQPYVIVLAGNTREGRRYAKLAGLPKGRHRVVFSAKQVRGLRRAEIHELPSFARRPDRHGINAALRYAKGERIQVTMPADVEQDPRGQLTQRQLDVAYRFNALRDIPALDAVAELAKDAELEQMSSNGDTPEDLLEHLAQVAEVRSNVELALVKATDQGDGQGEQLTIDGGQEPVKQKQTRRSRCKVCQVLVSSDDDPAHDSAAHEAQDAKTLGKPAPSPASFFGGRGD